MTTKPTLKSLSNLLGLHPSLISRVLRGASDARVSDEKRQLIIDTARQVGYRPDRMGRSLKFRSSKIVAVLTPDITNPFHSLLFRGAESAARLAGYQVILCHVDDAVANGLELMESVTQGLVDGVLVACAWTPDPRLKALKTAGLPYVLINRPSGDAGDVQFVPDDVETGRLAAQALIERGHRRIVALFSDLRIGNMKGRRDSFAEFLRELDPRCVLTVFDGITQKSELRRLCAQLMSGAADRPSAIFVPHSQQAATVLEEALRHRVRVPDDLSVLGYGGDVDSAISAVCVPAEAMGAHAMKALIGLIEHGAAPTGETYRPILNDGVTLSRYRD